MPRNVFTGNKMDHLHVGARSASDRDTVNRFKAYCDQNGLSHQRGLLNTIQAFLSFVSPAS